MSMFNYYCDEVKKIIEEVKPNYPQLTTYEKEWLYFHEHEYNPGTPVDLEYTIVETSDRATVLDAIPFSYKSAILKGVTLVNLPTSTRSGNLQANYVQILTQEDCSLLKPSTKYFLKIFNHTSEDKKYTTHPTLFVFQSTPVLANSSSTYIISTNSDVSSGSCLLRNETNHDLDNSLDVLLIEYQEGMENWDISYFEGMQSVKMPVFKTTGKNLFGGIIELGGISTATGLDTTWSSNFRTSFMRVPKNNTKFLFTFNYKGSQMSGGYLIFIYYNENKERISSQTVGNREPFNFNQDAYYYRITQNIGNNIDILDITNIQLEEGTVATSYEPYKSNILTVNEDVTLRSNGDVCDELNLLTGRLTQRIDENNEVLAQGVVKTVKLTDKLSKPYEGTNHYETYSDTIQPIMFLEVPVVSTGNKTLLDIQNQD